VETVDTAANRLLNGSMSVSAACYAGDGAARGETMRKPRAPRIVRSVSRDSSRPALSTGLLRSELNHTPDRSHLSHSRAGNSHQRACTPRRVARRGLMYEWTCECLCVIREYYTGLKTSGLIAGQLTLHAQVLISSLHAAWRYRSQWACSTSPRPRFAN